MRWAYIAFTLVFLTACASEKGAATLKRASIAQFQASIPVANTLLDVHPAPDGGFWVAKSTLLMKSQVH